jgi:phenylacetic acid degradation operon negative regulatory protein
MSFIASYREIGDENEMVSRSWELSELDDNYEHFIHEFTGLQPSAGQAVLHAQTRLVHEWRRFPCLDPELPLRLLPVNWSGTQAAEIRPRKRPPTSRAGPVSVPRHRPSREGDDR